MPNNIPIFAGDPAFKQSVSSAFGSLPTSWLTANTPYTLPSITGLASAPITTITVNGAKVNSGHIVMPPQFSADTTGLMSYGWVSVTNTVSVIWFNPTGGTINIGSGTLYVAVGIP